MRTILKTSHVTGPDAIPMFTSMQPARLKRRSVPRFMWFATGLVGILFVMLTR